jgi:large subunit ribosomal protein L32e
MNSQDESNIESTTIIKKHSKSNPQKKPDFKRQESWRYIRVKEKWRRPRGIDSKMRKSIKGWPKSPKAGYRSPKKTRGLHPSGYFEVIVSSLNDLDKVDPETNIIRISGTVGRRKRMEILTLAREKGVRTLNPGEEPIFDEELEIDEEKNA